MGTTTTTVQHEHAVREEDRMVAALHRITAPELQQLGLQHIAYLEAVHKGGGICGYVIHAADGHPLAMVDNINLAIQIAGEKHLILVPVH